ncbi:MAG: hypothetical protein R3E32_28550 [Chitinophagales bacterium]
MAYSTDLFDLIQTLSRTEKAYIKKYGYKQDKDGDNVYWQLFDSIDKQEEYDEEKLLKKFRGHKITKQFSAAKNYLYGLILSSLTDYDQSKDIESQLMDSIKEINALRKRSLHAQAYKKLEAAKKIALKEKKAFLYQQLLKSELFLLPFTKENFEKRTVIYQEMKQTHDRIELARAYNELYVKWLKAEQEIGSALREENKLLPLEELLQDPLLKDESNALTFNTRFQFNEIHCRYHICLNNHKMALQYAKRMVALFEEEPEHIQMEPIGYLMALDALLHCYPSLHDVEGFEETVATFRKAREHPYIKKLQKEYPGLYYGLEASMLSTYITWKEYEKALQIVPKLQANFKKYHHSKNILRLNQYLIVLTFFYNGQFEVALDEIQILMDDKEFEEESDLACFIRIVYLILHFELQNDLMVAYNIRNTYRFLLRHKQLYKVEEFILRFLRRTPDLLTQEDLNKSLRNLHRELSELTKDPYESQAFNSFNFLDWIESKLQKVGILEVVAKDKSKVSVTVRN